MQNTTIPQINLHLIGETACGKTKILERFYDNKFSNGNFNLGSLQIKYKNIEIEDKIIRLKIVDHPGQYRFRNASTPLLKNAMGVLLVYSLNDVKSLQSVIKWIDYIKQYAPQSVKILLIANKSDIKNQSEIQNQQGQNLANHYGFKFFETSAKDGTNIIDAFECLIKQIMAQEGQNKCLQLTNFQQINEHQNNKCF